MEERRVKTGLAERCLRVGGRGGDASKDQVEL